MDETRMPETIAKGAHPGHEAMCVMEAVAYVAGEPWSDRPGCASTLATNAVWYPNEDREPTDGKA